MADSKSDGLDAGSMTGIYCIDLPVDIFKVYKVKEDAMDAIAKASKAKGFHVAARPSQSGSLTINMVCNEKALECPFKVNVEANKDRDQIEYQIKVVNNAHNHPPSSQLLALGGADLVNDEISEDTSSDTLTASCPSESHLSDGNESDGPLPRSPRLKQPPDQSLPRSNIKVVIPPMGLTMPNTPSKKRARPELTDRPASADKSVRINHTSRHRLANGRTPCTHYDRIEVYLSELEKPSAPVHDRKDNCPSATDPNAAAPSALHAALKTSTARTGELDLQSASMGAPDSIWAQDPASNASATIAIRSTNENKGSNEVLQDREADASIQRKAPTQEAHLPASTDVPASSKLLIGISEQNMILAVEGIGATPLKRLINQPQALLLLLQMAQVSKAQLKKDLISDQGVLLGHRLFVCCARLDKVCHLRLRNSKLIFTPIQCARPMDTFRGISQTRIDDLVDALCMLTSEQRCEVQMRCKWISDIFEDYPFTEEVEKSDPKAKDIIKAFADIPAEILLAEISSLAAETKLRLLANLERALWVIDQ